MSLSCYGRLLHTAIAGWDDKECVRTFEAVGQSTMMLRHLETIVKYKSGLFSRIMGVHFSCSLINKAC